MRPVEKKNFLGQINLNKREAKKAKLEYQTNMPPTTASTPAETAEAARELNLVGKVELRIALADSDSKLQSILNTYLPPLLLKLASEHLSVRNKVSSFGDSGIGW
jgi:hypothetical protein